ncbi:MAG: hypothetical protein KBA64_02005 [Armatimonadetes bacterium]|nr:hypothetical protein [Armatimonadota bacterium]
MVNAKREQVVPGRFPLGSVCVTRGAAGTLDEDDIRRAVGRHAGRDWGDVCAADWDRNDRSVEEGCRLLSAYRSRAGIPFWVITEPDRSVTTVLLPEEY